MNALKYLIFFTLSSSTLLGQNVKWSNASKWKLYSTFPRNLDTLSKDSLSTYPSVELDNDTIAQFLSTVAVIPKERTIGARWMGAPYWVSYEAAGSIYILKVSTYGGFFVDGNDGLYYELPIEERGQWLSYFSHQSILLQGRKYSIP
jgi:hypothetical protein